MPLNGRMDHTISNRVCIKIKYVTLNRKDSSPEINIMVAPKPISGQESIARWRPSLP